MTVRYSDRLPVATDTVTVVHGIGKNNPAFLTSFTYCVANFNGSLGDDDQESRYADLFFYFYNAVTELSAHQGSLIHKKNLNFCINFPGALLRYMMILAVRMVRITEVTRTLTTKEYKKVCL